MHWYNKNRVLLLEKKKKVIKCVLRLSNALFCAIVCVVPCVMGVCVQIMLIPKLDVIL